MNDFGFCGTIILKNATDSTDFGRGSSVKSAAFFYGGITKLE